MKLKFFYINVLSALEYNPNEKYIINFMINKAILWNECYKSMQNAYLYWMLIKTINIKKIIGYT